jgi:hypothetical protein
MKVARIAAVAAAVVSAPLSPAYAVSAGAKMKIAVIPAVLAAGFACAPLAKADIADQSAAEQAVTAIYNQVQRGCTPRTPPHLQAINWSTFYPGSFGEGRIVDANSSLGGPFKVYFTNPRVGPATDSTIGRAYGQWNVDLEFCCVVIVAG